MSDKPLFDTNEVTNLFRPETPVMFREPTTMPLGFDFSIEEGKTVDAIIDELGKLGGPSEAGWHSWEEVTRCPRADYFLRKGVQGEESSKRALRIGAVLHEMFSHYYAHFLPDVTPNLAAQQAYVDNLIAALNAAGHEEVSIEASRLYYAHLIAYPPASDDYLTAFKVVAVERAFERQFPWGGLYTGRADLVLKGPDGYVIVDHKTTSREDRDFLEGWRLDPQQLGLAWCVSKTLKPVVGYSINGIIKTMQPKYRRMMFQASKKLTRDWLNMMQWYTNLRRLSDMAGNPPNYSQCIRRYGRCRFWEPCSYGLKKG